MIKLEQIIVIFVMVIVVAVVAPMLLESDSINYVTNNTSGGNNTIKNNYVVDIRDTTIGDYSTPIATYASSGSSNIVGVGNGSSSQDTSGWLGIIDANEYKGLPAGNTITSVGLNIKNVVGSVRMKVYKDDGAGGLPSTLLGETGSNVITSSGKINFTIAATIPASGNVWVGFETNNNALDLYYANSGGNECYVVHAYGAGSNPFGACTSANNLNFQYYINYQPTAPYPSSNVIDNNLATFWDSDKETHAWIYVDTGGLQILTGAAVYWNGTSTATQIAVQTSNDSSSWNTKRTINTNLLTDKAWNYFRWDLDGGTERYVRFYANDASAKELSFYEIKILHPSLTTVMLRHGHQFLDSTNATLPLNQ